MSYNKPSGNNKKKEPEVLVLDDSSDDDNVSINSTSSTTSSRPRRSSNSTSEDSSDSDDSDDSVEFVNKGKGSSAKGKARRATSKSDKVARRMNKSKGYDTDTTDEDVLAQRSAPKKVKTTTTATKDKRKGKAVVPKHRGNTGKLSKLTTMPLDILLEIASSLDSLTLLNLSRVSKNFRQLLMSKKSSSVWIAARWNSELPEYHASDLSEPAYASLLVERNCVVCGRKGATIVEYTLRARWCKVCQKATLVKEIELARHISPIHPNTFDCVPSTFVSAAKNLTKQRHFFKPSVVSMNAKLLDLQRRANHERKYDAYIEDDGPAVTALTEFLATRLQAVADATMDGNMLDNWSKMSKKDRKIHNRQLKQQRMTAIIGKLRALGYNDNEIDLHTHRKLIRKAQPLTDTIWEHIRLVLIADCNALRAFFAPQPHFALLQPINLKPLITPLYTSLLDSDPDPIQRALFPSESDFLQLKSVQPFWQPGYMKTTIDPQAWNGSLPYILNEVDQWKRQNKQRQFRLLATRLFKAGVALPDLTLVKLMSDPRFPEDPTSMTTHFDDTEMDELFGRFGSSLLCVPCGSLKRWPEVCRHVQMSHGVQQKPFEAFLLVSNESWFATLGGIAEAVGGVVMDGRVMEGRARGLGEVWECERCSPELFWSGGAVGGAEGVKKKGMGFDELIRHLAQYHANALRADGTTKLPSVRDVLGALLEWERE